MKKGLLLINLGTPNQPTLGAVRTYLREFLMDKRVIDLPYPFRFVLVQGLIIPFRARRTTSLYQRIWTEAGSPLLVNSRSLQDALQKRLGDTVQVVLGMRYGQPSIQQALAQLQDCQSITVLPLYPQYASAVTHSSLDEVLRCLASTKIFPSLSIIRDFYQHPAFIEAYAQLIQPYLVDHEHVLFSYHGIPERHLEKLGCKPVCQVNCPPISATNASCYRAQCQQTTKAIVKNLHLAPTQYSMSFQSRLGKTPWIKPYTDAALEPLIQQGVRRLAVVCPSFTADCLETLEEIGIRAEEQWRALGGTQLSLVPSLNSSDKWVEAISHLIAN